ncbi:hypothetical protein HYALB_00000116 [Hymenoscyphus albidus]|uniref:P-loop containing nucleoside triphosphate hydrolase protein n=1 Tax=Hymenoscyphus albidus TaxID=595503 RepID=A0A9N9LGK5_9HELO|nr:hypothetical protein HYALB_00000116 [Hymenoscyphus albidus]
MRQDMLPASRRWKLGIPRWRPIFQAVRWNRYATTSTAVDSATPAPVKFPLKIRLRQYQEECIQAVLDHIDKGHKRMGISLATGSGKTVIFTQLIGRIKPHTKEATQTLILAHRKELVEQAARHCINAYPTKSVEIEMASSLASGHADITVASIYSIISGDRLAKFDADRFKLVLVDEAHHIVSPGYRKALEHFDLGQKMVTSPALVGVSATLSRFDGLKLGSAIDQIVYHKDYIDMIGEKWLSDVMFTTVHTKADISRVQRAPNGDFKPNELSKVVNTESVNKVTVLSWLTKAKGRKSTLAFCVDISHVHGLVSTFRKYGIDARFILGETKKTERSDTLDAFKRGEFPVLVNCGVFTEGTDIPNIDCVILARPTKSRNLLVQMIGRGMRLHPGKKNCHIIDMVASLNTGVITTPTLFGLDPLEVVEGATPEDMEEIRDRNLDEELENDSIKPEFPPSKITDQSPVSNIVTFTDYDSIFDLLEDISAERHVRLLSPNSWINVGPDRYVLSSGKGNSYVKIELVLDDETDTKMFLVTELATLIYGNSNSPLARPRTIAKCLTFEDAVHAADTFASKKYIPQLILRNQPWQNAPATEGQLKFLNKLRTSDNLLTPAMITKGKAGEMITKLRHGARGRWTKHQQRKEREMKAKIRAENERELKEREKVSVGPLKA